METKLNLEIRTVLEKFNSKYFIGGIINKNRVIRDLDRYDAELVEKILTNEELKKRFTLNVAGATVIKVNDFIEIFEQDEYWQDSYTKYSKKIGLTTNGKFLDETSEVVLDFPYKDTVLKASMSKEDTDQNDLKPDEPFLNEVIAQDEIDTLLDKKILVNAKRYTKNSVEEANTFNEDNLILKGNNLLALHTFKEKYLGKVKLIYLDPPYNTGGDGFQYNDRFNHSAWLTFMKNRLEIAYDLLNDEGILWVQTDDGEVNYLGVLLDNIFGRNNFINIVTVKTKIGGVSGSAEGKSLKDTTEFIQVYAKNKEHINLEPVYAMTPVWNYIQEEYIEVGKSWKYTSVLTELGERKLIKYDERANRKYYHYPNAKQMSVKQYAKENNMMEEEVYNSVPDKIFQTTNAQTSVRITVMEETLKINTGVVSIEYIPTKGKNKNKLTEVLYTSTKRMFMFLSDMLAEDKDGNLLYKEKLTTLWDNIQYNNLSKEGKIDFPNGKKPEKLLQNIIEMSSYKGDVVLDFFGGSGSTAAVANKLGRKWISCEQIDTQIEIMKERLHNVINGTDDKGISADIQWQGGGSFVYAELMEKNAGFIKKIINVQNMTELQSIFKRMMETADFDFRVDLTEVQTNDLWQQSLDYQKRLLIKVIDKNQLYYNYSEIDDENVRDLISDNDYEFNKSFYADRGE
ncbi:MAG: DNA methyltransferase [Lactococcus cremoris]